MSFAIIVYQANFARLVQVIMENCFSPEAGKAVNGFHVFRTITVMNQVRINPGYPRLLNTV